MEKVEHYPELDKILLTVLFTGKNIAYNPDNQANDIYRASLWDKNQFTIGGYLNVRLILEKFVSHFYDLYADSEEKFIEEYGRRLFLLYLRLIINGTGNYYIESRTRSMGRTADCWLSGRLPYEEGVYAELLL